MEFKLFFKSIAGNPQCTITANGTAAYTGPVTENITCDVPVSEGNVDIVIQTVIEPEGVQAFELHDVVIDGVPGIQAFLWDLAYSENSKGEKKMGDLFCWRTGKIVIPVQYPAEAWTIRFQANLHRDDPQWEEDVFYYEKTCQLLKRILNK